jgi:hypothetical protein
VYAPSPAPPLLPSPALPCTLADPEASRRVPQVGEDPWTVLRQEKRERVKRGAAQQLANVKLAAKASGALPPTLKLAATLPVKGSGVKQRKRKEMVDEVIRGVGSGAQLQRSCAVAACLRSAGGALWLRLHPRRRGLAACGASSDDGHVVGGNTQMRNVWGGADSHGLQAVWCLNGLHGQV